MGADCQVKAEASEAVLSRRPTGYGVDSFSPVPNVDAPKKNFVLLVAGC